MVERSVFELEVQKKCLAFKALTRSLALRFPAEDPWGKAVAIVREKINLHTTVEQRDELGLPKNKTALKAVDISLQQAAIQYEKEVQLMRGNIGLTLAGVKSADLNSTAGRVVDMIDPNHPTVGIYASMIENVALRYGISTADCAPNAPMPLAEKVRPAFRREMLQTSLFVAQECLKLIGKDRYERLRKKLAFRLFHYCSAEELSSHSAAELVDILATKDGFNSSSVLPQIWAMEMMMLSANNSLIDDIINSPLKGPFPVRTWLQKMMQSDRRVAIQKVALDKTSFPEYARYMLLDRVKEHDLNELAAAIARLNLEEERSVRHFMVTTFPGAIAKRGHTMQYISSLVSKFFAIGDATFVGNRFKLKGRLLLIARACLDLEQSYLAAPVSVTKSRPESASLNYKAAKEYVPDLYLSRPAAAYFKAQTCQANGKKFSILPVRKGKRSYDVRLKVITNDPRDLRVLYEGAITSEIFTPTNPLGFTNADHANIKQLLEQAVASQKELRGVAVMFEDSSELDALAIAIRYIVVSLAEIFPDDKRFPAVIKRP